VVVLAFAVWHQREVQITGRFSLRSWDGTASVPQPARALVFSRGTIVGQLRERLDRWPAQRASAEAAVEGARKAWREKSAAREEALRILRVAERSNAADLAACRERHDEAVRAADEAYADLERAARRVEMVTEPALLLAELTGPVDEAALEADGCFTLRARDRAGSVRRGGGGRRRGAGACLVASGGRRGRRAGGGGSFQCESAHRAEVEGLCGMACEAGGRCGWRSWWLIRARRLVKLAGWSE